MKFLICFLFPFLSYANSYPVKIGELPKKIIPEASGIAYIKEIKKLIHTNDSGDGPFLYTTELDGSGLEKWSYGKLNPVDVEDLAIGPCGKRDSRSCLYIGDIGDNDEKRENIVVTLIDLEDFLDERKELTPLKILKLKYPDHAHNAESLAVDNDGTIFILTKEKKVAL
jgi:hypothetical protein